MTEKEKEKERKERVVDGDAEGGEERLKGFDRKARR